MKNEKRKNVKSEFDLPQPLLSRRGVFGSI
jgi:hypothetical protein